MFNDAVVSNRNPNRNGLLFKLAGGAMVLGGLVAVGIAAVASSMLPSEAKSIREDPRPDAQAPVSRPADAKVSDNTAPMSTEISEEADPYAAVQGCRFSATPSSTASHSTVATTKAASPASPVQAAPNK
jgi:hypothetical protein